MATGARQLRIYKKKIKWEQEVCGPEFWDLVCPKCTRSFISIRARERVSPSQQRINSHLDWLNINFAPS